MGPQSPFNNKPMLLPKPNKLACYSTYGQLFEWGITNPTISSRPSDGKCHILWRSRRDKVLS